MAFTFNAEPHEYRLDGRRLPSVTQVLHGVGIIDTSFFVAGSANHGIHIHRICEWSDKGELDEATLDPHWWPYHEAWKDFRSKFSLEESNIETPLYHAEYGFAGTPDRYRPDFILDIKSGAPAAWHALQTAAYKILTRCYAAKRFTVYLSAAGTWKLDEHKDKDDEKVFLAALAVYNWKGNHNGNRS